MFVEVLLNETKNPFYSIAQFYWKMKKFKKKKLGLTLCKTEQPLQAMELQEKEEKKDENGTMVQGNILERTLR